MRAVSVHRDALVVTSRMWQTTATVVRAGDEAMLIDAPYFPDELEALPALLAQAGFEPDGLVATHARLRPPARAPRVPGPAARSGGGHLPSACAPSRARPQRALRDHDDEHYVVRPAPLGLGARSSRCRCPGRLDLGETELELHPAEGHTADGCALFARAAGLLVVGDYLSDVELPMISEGGSLAGYRATLARLAPLVEEAETVVPGHGSPHDRDTALRILDEDVDYLDALERGEERPALPEGRSSRAQRRMHAENLARVG